MTVSICFPQIFRWRFAANGVELVKETIHPEVLASRNRISQRFGQQGSAGAAVQASRQAEARVIEQQQAQAEEKGRKPVKNAEGQTTGTVVNTTA